MQKFLVPAFLKRLDHYLLLHNRLLWISKIHHVLFYSILALAFGSACIYAYPLTPASDLPEMSTVLLVAIGLVSPACIYWIYWQKTYKIEADFGLRFRGMAYTRFGLYWLCFAIFSALPFAFSMMVERKMVNLVSAEQLVNDANTLNIGNPYIPSNMENDIIWNDYKAYYTTGGIGRHIIIENDTILYDYDEKDIYDFQYFFAGVGYIENNLQIVTSANYMKSADEFFDLFFEKKSNKKFVLQAIENYIATFNKYNPSKIKHTPQNFLDSYLKKEILFADHLNKLQVQNQLFKFSKIHSEPFVKDTVRFLLQYFLITFSLSILLFNFVYVRTIEFIIGFLSTIGLVVGVIYLAAPIEAVFREIQDADSGLERIIIDIILSFLFIFSMFFCIRNDRYASQNSYFRYIILVTTNLIAFCVLIALSSSLVHWYLGYEYTPEEETKRNIVFGISNSFILVTYYFLFIPLFHKFFVKMRSLPR
jgi:hypothetical protein